MVKIRALKKPRPKKGSVKDRHEAKRLDLAKKCEEKRKKKRGGAVQMKGCRRKPLRAKRLGSRKRKETEAQKRNRLVRQGVLPPRNIVDEPMPDFAIVRSVAEEDLQELDRMDADEISEAVALDAADIEHAPRLSESLGDSAFEQF